MKPIGLTTTWGLIGYKMVMDHKLQYIEEIKSQIQVILTFAKSHGVLQKLTLISRMFQCFPHVNMFWQRSY